MLANITLLIIMLFSISCRADAGSIQDAVESGRANASQYSEGLQLFPESISTGASQAAEAQKGADAVNSESFQKRVTAEKERLQVQVFGMPPVQKQVLNKAEAQRRMGHAVPRLAADERVYLFVSSSMPEEALRAYAQDMDRLQDPNISMVMRGFIGGIQDASATMEFLMRIRKREPGCSGANCETFGTPIDIDPNLYRRFKPVGVPALVYVRGVKTVDPDVSEGSPENVPIPAPGSWAMIYGDVSLGYLFEKVAAATSSNSLTTLARYLGR